MLFALAFGLSLADYTGVWVGQVNNPHCSSQVPIQIDWDAKANLVKYVSWTFFETCNDGGSCTVRNETNLAVTVNETSQTWRAGGGGAFYLEAKLHGNPGKERKLINGKLHDANGKSITDLTFWATKDGQECGDPVDVIQCPVQTNTTRPFIWPLPRQYSNGPTTIEVVPSSEFFLIKQQSPLLTAAFGRYQKIMFPHAVSAVANPISAAAQITVLHIAVNSTDEGFPALSLNTDESYTLSINSDASGGSFLHAGTVFGCLRGLETFSQLVRFNFDLEQYQVAHSPWSIGDAPRFAHRGLMIDTARHFLPVRTILDMVDSLSYAKLNVLHWHMSDFQSFPLEVKSAPKLWDGAYSAQERYTQADAAAVVEHARLRGVRVMVEFDMPGHAASWCKGYPEVCPSLDCPQPLNVASNRTFELIDGLLAEIAGSNSSSNISNNSIRTSASGSAVTSATPGVFKDHFVHLGGDEVNTACWSSTPAIAAWMAARNMSADGDDAYAYFVKRVAEIALSHGKRPVQWSEVYDHFKNTLPKEVIIHIWKRVTNVTEPLAGGYNVILNVGYDDLSWYLDNLDTDWAHVYRQEPCCGVPDHLCPLILGGQGEMWGESVDASDLERTVWPRLAAVAERLWSPRHLNDTADAHQRIAEFRCLLNRRGVTAAPVDNMVARNAPPGPGSCALQ